jgi:hypothetical protein
MSSTFRSTYCLDGDCWHSLQESAKAYFCTMIQCGEKETNRPLVPERFCRNYDGLDGRWNPPPLP